jgi:hypothetical protein
MGCIWMKQGVLHWKLILMFMFLVFVINLCGPVSGKYVHSAFSTAVFYALQCLCFSDSMYDFTQHCSQQHGPDADMFHSSTQSRQLILFSVMVFSCSYFFSIFKMCLVSALVRDLLQLLIYCSASWVECLVGLEWLQCHVWSGGADQSTSVWWRCRGVCRWEQLPREARANAKLFYVWVSCEYSW